MAKISRDPVREQHWRERVTAWAASGLSVRAFCQQHQLTETTFHHWRRELRDRDDAAASPARPRFVPVTVLPAAEPVASSATLAVDVRCPSGHVVTVPVDDPATLRTLFAALASLAEEPRPC